MYINSLTTTKFSWSRFRLSELSAYFDSLQTFVVDLGVFSFGCRLVTCRLGLRSREKPLRCDKKLMCTQKYLKCSQFSVGVFMGKEHTCTDVDVRVFSISCSFESERGTGMDV